MSASPRSVMAVPSFTPSCPRIKRIGPSSSGGLTTERLQRSAAGQAQQVVTPLLICGSLDICGAIRRVNGGYLCPIVVAKRVELMAASINGGNNLVPRPEPPSAIGNVSSPELSNSRVRIGRIAERDTDNLELSH